MKGTKILSRNFLDSESLFPIFHQIEDRIGYYDICGVYFEEKNRELQEGHRLGIVHYHTLCVFVDNVQNNLGIKRELTFMIEDVYMSVGVLKD